MNEQKRVPNLAPHKIRARLEEKRWTQADLAAAIGDTPQHVGMVLNEHTVPLATWPARVATALGLTIADIYE